MILTKELERAEREKYLRELAEHACRIMFWVVSVIIAFALGALA